MSFHFVLQYVCWMYTGCPRRGHRGVAQTSPQHESHGRMLGHLHEWQPICAKGTSEERLGRLFPTHHQPGLCEDIQCLIKSWTKIPFANCICGRQLARLRVIWLLPSLYSSRTQDGIHELRLLMECRPICVCHELVYIKATTSANRTLVSYTSSQKNPCDHPDNWQ